MRAPRRPLQHQIHEGLVFFSGFLRHPDSVRSMSQSSRHMVKQILRHTGTLNGNVILEFGAGLGRVTEELLKAMGPKSRLVSFENHGQYAEHLRRTLKDPRLTVVKDVASRAAHHLKRLNLGHANQVISTAPLRKMNGRKIAVAAASCLPPGARYVQIGLWCKKDVFQPEFKYLRQQLVLRNFPPELIHVLERAPAKT